MSKNGVIWYFPWPSIIWHGSRTSCTHSGSRDAYAKVQPKTIRCACTHFDFFLKLISRNSTLPHPRIPNSRIPLRHSSKKRKEWSIYMYVCIGTRVCCCTFRTDCKAGYLPGDPIARESKAFRVNMLDRRMQIQAVWARMPLLNRCASC